MSFFDFFKPDLHRQQALTINNQLVQRAEDLASGGTLYIDDDFNHRFEIMVFFAARILFEFRENHAFSHVFWETIFDGFDYSLRERGVNDIRIGARMNKLHAHATGRRNAFLAAWEGDDKIALADAIARNILNGASPDDPRVAVLLEQLPDLVNDVEKIGVI